MNEKNLNIALFIMWIILIGTIIYALGWIGVMAVVIAALICGAGMQLMK